MFTFPKTCIYIKENNEERKTEMGVKDIKQWSLEVERRRS